MRWPGLAYRARLGIAIFWWITEERPPTPMQAGKCQVCTTEARLSFFKGRRLRGFLFGGILESWEGYLCIRCARDVYRALQRWNWLTGWLSGPVWWIVFPLTVVGNRHWLNEAQAAVAA